MNDVHNDPTNLYRGAREATVKLRHWVLRTYSLAPSRIPEPFTTSLDQMDLAVSDSSFCGYLIGSAPHDLIEPIARYLAALRNGRAGKRSRKGLPIYLVREHQRVVAGKPRRKGASRAPANGADQ
jgi:hypothetical protein